MIYTLEIVVYKLGIAIYTLEIVVYKLGIAIYTLEMGGGTGILERNRPFVYIEKVFDL